MEHTHAFKKKDELEALIGRDYSFVRADVSADGRRRVEARNDGTLQFIDPLVNREMATFRIDGGHFIGVKFSPDGAQLAVEDLNGSVHIWDTRDAAARQADRDARASPSARPRTH